MGLADLHIHTIYSWDGTCTIQGVLKQAAHEIGLDLVAITDHDEIQGALRARDLAPGYGIEAIVGEEVTTRDGHLLCLFLEHKIPPGLTLEETVLRAADQGGLCIAAHPASRGICSINEERLNQALMDPRVASTLVGLEAFNAGLIYQGSNRAARELGLRCGLSLTGSSDAHLSWMIGMGATSFPGRGAEDFRRALVQRQTSVVYADDPSPIHCLYSWALRYGLRRLGWVTGNIAPQHPLAFARLAEAW